MANTNAFLQTFAGGEFGDAMAARVGIEAYQASCQRMENFFPSAQGPMSRRPSLEYIDSFVNSDLKGIVKAFQFDVGQNYLLLITSNGIEYFLNDGKLEIPEITATISNGTFTNFTGWTDNSQSGATAAASGGVMTLTSNGAAESKARTTFTINEADEIHVLAFDVRIGPVNLRIGSSAGGEQFLSEMELRPGHHRLAFTPTGSTCHIEFWHVGNSAKQVDNVSLLPGPALSMPTPWAEEDMRGVYSAQDGDRLFMFHRDYPPRVLERRGHRSWSLIFFLPDDGPFDDGDSTILLTPSGRTGNITITASRALFTSDDFNRLLRLTHNGQFARMIANRDAVYSPAIKVVGIGGDRSFTMTTAGTYTATVTLQRSVGNENNFTDVITRTTANTWLFNDSYPDSSGETTGGHDDDLYTATNNVEGTLNNLTVYYRLAIKPGNYTSGTVTANLTYNGGGSTVGVARITNFNSATSVDAEVIQHFATAGATDIWDIGAWSADQEFPNAVAFSAGRLWTARRRRLWASVSDDYFSFDDTGEADGSIDITLRSKSSEGVRWMRHLDFLCVGTRNEEYVIRPLTIAEPIGPSNVEPALMSEEGGADIEATVGGDSILFVHRSRRRLFQFVHNPRALTESSFVAVDLNRLNQETVEDGIVNMAIQQEPERRIFVVLASGIVKACLFRREEEIVAWSTFTTENGFIEDVCTFPENDVDATYFVVRRKIGSIYVRMIERLSNEVVLNDEDLVHLDSMLQTDIERPESILTFDQWEAGETVVVSSSQSVFNVGHEGQMLWADLGRIRIDTYNSAFEVEGTILNSLRGQQDPDNEENTIAVPVGPSRWGIAPQLSSIVGLEHLEGETVHVWADKAYFGTAVVSSGAIALSEPASRIFVGKRMLSSWVSLKLAYSAQKGTAVMQRKICSGLGFILRRTADGLKFGQGLRRMKELILQESSPTVEAGVPFFSGERDEAFNGLWDTDPRISIQAITPGPATVVGLVPNVQINER